MVDVALALVIALLAVVCGFQIILAFGAPLGEYAFGGQNKGTLPKRFRIASAVSVFVYVAIVFHYLNEWPGKEFTNWVLVAFNALSLLMNSVTRSAKERKLWAPIAFLLLLCSLIIALS